VSVTREDMLRELELLPAWRARVPASLQAEAPVLPEFPVVGEGVAAVSAEEVDASLSEPLIETVIAQEPVNPRIHSESPAEPGLQADSPVLIQAIEPVVQTQWLLYCPQAGEASQPLLQNIVRALQLPPEAVSLHLQPVHPSQVKASFCVLFGLAQANQFLGADYQEIAAVRGRILMHGDMAVVVTHHPQAMLETPLLKRETWQDLCLLLARQVEQTA
jgi:uracil-DNA glycosylase